MRNKIKFKFPFFEWGWARETKRKQRGNGEWVLKVKEREGWMKGWRDEYVEEDGGFGCISLISLVFADWRLVFQPGNEPSVSSSVCVCGDQYCSMLTSCLCVTWWSGRRVCRRELQLTFTSRLLKEKSTLLQMAFKSAAWSSGSGEFL